MIEFSEVQRMYLRNYLKYGERHMEAATLLFEHGFHDYSVKEAYESMLWNLDALLLTVDIQTFKSSTAISWFGKKFVKEEIYPIEFYEHLLLASSAHRIADSEFGATTSKDEAGTILGYARNFKEIVAYLKEFTVDPKLELKKEILPEE